MSRVLFLFIGLALPACLGAAGCGGGVGEVPVSGEVILDNEPLKEGLIRFAPVDGSTTTQAATIKDGKFETRLHCTTYRVEISSPRVTQNPRRVSPPGPGDDDPLVEELVPPRYNRHSELQLEVPKARRDVCYDLKSM